MSAPRHAGALEAEGDVVAHGEMRKQRVVLEHHVDGPLMRQHRRDVAAVEQDAALVRRLETGEHAQQRGLAAAARAQQREELAGPDVEREPVHGAETAERLGDPLDASSGASAASAGGAGPAGVAGTSTFGASISGDSSVMPPASSDRGRTLAADRLPLNASQARAKTNIMDAAAPRSGKVRGCQKSSAIARGKKVRGGNIDDRSLLCWP